MTIRKTDHKDIERVLEVYAEARKMMIEGGNPSQWGTVHPPRALIESDIREGFSYVCCDNDNNIIAVFYLREGPDSSYTKIDGAWLNDESYGVVHRLARTESASGAGAFCLEWCYKKIPNIRIDTHKDNAPMLRLLGKLGYVHCGTIRIENGDERMAFQKVFILP